MKSILTTLAAAVVFISASAYQFTYNFRNIPVSQAVVQISKDHPDLNINLIYNELNSYRTSATVRTDDAYSALRQTIGLNPITIVKKGNAFFIEALQHGRYCYTGRAVDSGNEPVVAATVMLLAPRDSTVITYGVTDENGRFSIPCDHTGVIAKLSCMGYQTTYRKATSFALGTIVMPEKTFALNTVNVEAETAHIYSDKTVYVPTSRQKNASQTGIDLLDRMAVPQLIVDPSGLSVRTVSGQPVQIFIDSSPATSQDLDGLNISDVKRVEVLFNPRDVRYRGAEYVVNFVMQKYEYGGYGKGTIGQWFGYNRFNVVGYDKIVYKKMTFDLFVDGALMKDKHRGYVSEETFRLPDFQGTGEQTIGRKSATTSSQFKNFVDNVSFRAVYASANTEITNLVQANYTDNPRDNSENALSYTNGFAPSSVASTLASKLNRSFNYEFEAYHVMSDKLAFNVDAGYRFEKNKSYSLYTNDDVHITNDAIEKYNYVKVQPSLVWNPDNHNNVFPFMHAEYATTKVDYFGNSPSRQNYDIWGYMAGLKYTHHRDKWSAGGLIGWTYANTTLTGDKIEDNYPQGNVFGSYTPNSKNQMELTYAFGKQVPDTYQKSPNMLQQNELMWVSGTPGLANYWNHHIRFTYTWMPGKTWQVAPTANYFTESNVVVPQYTPDGPGGSILKRYVNNGDYHYAMVGVNTTARFLGGKLVARINPMLTSYKINGEYNMSNRDFLCTAQLTAYFGQFYAYGWYATPMTELDSDTRTRERTPSRYQMQVGWGDSEWKISVTAYNFFNKGYNGMRRTLQSSLYSFNNTQLTPDFHQRFQVSVSCTIGYGRKVRPTDEVTALGTGPSAILK